MSQNGRENVWAIVVAAGSSQRFGAAKQYAAIGDRRVLDWSVAAARDAVDAVVVVVPADDAVAEGGVAGGRTRSESVRNGLAAVPADATIICVHDGARPFAGASLWSAVINAVVNGADGAVPAIAVTDTIKVVDDHDVVVETPPRERLRAVQTPQAFRAAVLRAAHADAPDGTDDAALVEASGGRVVVVAGDPDNRKITVPDDLLWARARVGAS